MIEENELKIFSPEDKEYVYELLEDKKFSDLKDFLKSKEDFDFTFTDEKGNTLLHLIVKACDKDKHNGIVLPLVQFLLINGVSHTAVNEKFRTPEDFALERSNAPLIGLFRGFKVDIE